MRTRLRGLSFGLCVLTALAIAGGSSAGPVAGAGVTYLDNGTILLGVDLDGGGAIRYLARSRDSTVNLIQSAQQSYYDGSWHVAAPGGEVVASSNDGRTIYTRVVPRTDDGERCACTFETWVTLRGAAAEVRNRLTSDRPVGGVQPPRWQELPALYSTGTAYRLFTYDGRAPYTGAPVRRIGQNGGQFGGSAASFAATEHWAALVGTGGRGVGLVVPDVTRFAGIPGTPAAVDQGGANGYLSATTPDVLDPHIVYSYRYSLVVGTVRSIRAYAAAHRPSPGPRYVFRSDRRHWWYVNAADEGTPPDGALRVRLDRDDPQMIGPEQWWSARRVPTLYVRGAWHTRQSSAELFWSTPGRSFEATRRLRFAVQGDGRFHTYRIRLKRSPQYAGTVTGLRLDPVTVAEIGAFADIECISWTRCPIDRETETRLERQPLAFPFRDTFDRGLGPIWHTSGSGTGASLAVTGGRLEVSIRSDAASGPPGGWVGAHVGTSCKLRGDFDVQVDFELLTWPAGNGVSAFLNTYFSGRPEFETIVRRSAPWAEVYDAGIAGVYTSALTTDRSGKLRLTRTADVLAASSWTGGGWRLVAARPAILDDAVIALGAASNDVDFRHRDVRVAFDNFSVNSGRLVCI